MTPLKHELAFDPTYGCDEDALRGIAAPPMAEGFAGFWQRTRVEAEAVALHCERRALPAPGPGWKLSEVYFDSWGGYRVGAWLLEPDARCSAGLVLGHGYGNPGAPGAPAAQDQLARLFVCMPGFSLSARADLPNEPPRHVVHGIASRDTYILRACVAAMWGATRALAELCPGAVGHLGYEGGSFGGGLGALAAPWEPAWRCLRLDVPTFGHHPWRLRCPCVGSGEAVRQHHAKHPEVVEVLRWYDAAVAATLVRAPVCCVPALFDPAVPPPGQWAVANALPAATTRIEAITAGHFVYVDQAAEAARVQAAWEQLRAAHL